MKNGIVKAEGNFVLAYGTLMKERPNHFKLGNAEFIGDTKFKGLMRNSEIYPTLFYGNNEYIGEVYKVNKHCMGILDRLEGYNEVTDRGHYVRRLINVSVDGIALECFVYINESTPCEGMEVLESGKKWNYGK